MPPRTATATFPSQQQPSKCKMQELEPYKLDNLVATMTDLLDQLAIEQVGVWGAGGEYPM